MFWLSRFDLYLEVILFPSNNWWRKPYFTSTKRRAFQSTELCSICSYVSNLIGLHMYSSKLQTPYNYENGGILWRLVVDNRSSGLEFQPGRRRKHVFVWNIMVRSLVAIKVSAVLSRGHVCNYSNKLFLWTLKLQNTIM